MAPPTEAPPDGARRRHGAEALTADDDARTATTLRVDAAASAMRRGPPAATEQPVRTASATSDDEHHRQDGRDDAARCRTARAGVGYGSSCPTIRATRGGARAATTSPGTAPAGGGRMAPTAPRPGGFEPRGGTRCTRLMVASRRATGGSRGCEDGAACWRAVASRCRSDWPVIVAAWLLLACATTLLAAGVLYSDTVARGGLRQAVLRGAAGRSRRRRPPVGRAAPRSTSLDALGPPRARADRPLPPAARSPWSSAPASFAAGRPTIRGRRHRADAAGELRGHRAPRDAGRRPLAGCGPRPARGDALGGRRRGARARDRRPDDDRQPARPRRRPRCRDHRALAARSPTIPYWIADPLELDGTQTSADFTTRGPARRGPRRRRDPGRVAHARPAVADAPVDRGAAGRHDRRPRGGHRVAPAEAGGDAAGRSHDDRSPPPCPTSSRRSAARCW